MRELVDKPEQKESSQDKLPAYIDMYTVEGHDPITSHALRRYEAAKKEFEKSYHTSQFSLIEQIKRAPQDEVADLIAQALSSENSEVQRQAVDMIDYAPYKERAWLRERVFDIINRALHSNDVRAQKKAVDMIGHAPDDKVTELIFQALQSNNIETQKVAANMIMFAPSTKKEELRDRVFDIIVKALQSDDSEAQRQAASMIIDAPYHKRTELITQAMDSDNNAVLREAIQMIEAVPYDEKIKLQKKAFEIIVRDLSSTDSEVQKEAIGMILHAPDDKIDELFIKAIYPALSSEYSAVQKEAAEMIEYAPDDKMAELITTALSSRNGEVQRIAASIIIRAPRDEREELQNKVFDLVNKSLQSNDSKIQRVGIGMIEYAPDDKRAELFELAKNKAGNALIEPPLYKGTEITKEHYKRKAFVKTGSGTTLVGGDLKDKTIIRHITQEAFRNWQRAYENYQAWKDAGFDYVPIEPIQSFRLNSKGLVDVSTQVLDLSFEAWRNMTSEFVYELEDDRNKILSIIASFGIYHGHTHDKNFVLRFLRDEKGNVDFTKKPRIYLIDFDAASSS